MKCRLQRMEDSIVELKVTTPQNENMIAYFCISGKSGQYNHIGLWRERKEAAKRFFVFRHFNDLNKLADW
ncbi:MAG: hypothetical protein QXW98_05175 [Candidatus Caldarchaeum sp.]